MKYLEGRELIQNGDMVFVHRNKKKFSFFANAISFVTRSEIYHCGIAVWMKADSGEKRLFLVEADLNDRRMVPLSLYDQHQMFVLAKPDEVVFDYFSNELIIPVGTQKYNILKAVEAGIRKYLLLPRLATDGEICSEMCLRMWRIGGFTKMKQELFTPDQLYSIMFLDYGVKRRVAIEI
jgi:hypothetical protein